MPKFDIDIKMFRFCDFYTNLGNMELDSYTLQNKVMINLKVELELYLVD